MKHSLVDSHGHQEKHYRQAFVRRMMKLKTLHMK